MLLVSIITNFLVWLIFARGAAGEARRVHCADASVCVERSDPHDGLDTIRDPSQHMQPPRSRCSFFRPRGIIEKCLNTRPTRPPNGSPVAGRTFPGELRSFSASS